VIGQDYYAVLEVPPGASPEAVQAAYRALCKKYHPDMGLPDASSERMVLLNEAYSVLGDKERRRDYDTRYLRAPGVRVRPMPDLACNCRPVGAGDSVAHSRVVQ
jgi:DnaJ-class molecular chaperone